MAQITATEFFELWTDFIQKEILNDSDWIKWYDDNKIWTEKTIGNKISETKKSPFGDYCITKKEQLRYRKEDGLTDLSFSLKQHFKDIYSLHENTDERREVISNNIFYPTFYEVLVEHENNIYLCYEEMIKLTYDRARLKVLITYNENVDKKSDYKFINEILTNNFRTKINQANTKHPENSETEYLLIIGQKVNNNLIWYSYIFDKNGKIYDY
jgi:hypothetical protein